MLGDIRGNSAGDASTEVLDLFFEPRGAIVGVLRTVPFEPFMASIWGLWLANLDRPKPGDGKD